MEQQQITLYNDDCLNCISSLSDNSVDLLYFNPPFGITDCEYDKPLDWDNLWIQIWRVLKKKGIVAIHASIPFTYKLALTQYKYLKYNWYWDKMCVPTGHLNSKKQPLRIIEEILIFYKHFGTYNPQMTPREIPLTIKEHNNGSHYNNGKNGKVNKIKKVETTTYKEKYPTHLIKMKRREHKFSTRPIAMCEFFIKTYSNENETILDLTCSDGQTAIACKKLNRKYIGCDIDKSMIDLVKKRLDLF